MQNKDSRALMRLVSKWLNEEGDEFVWRVIQDAHMGVPDSVFVTSDNAHLFRQFRNSVSSDPHDLISAAIRWRG